MRCVLVNGDSKKISRQFIEMGFLNKHPFPVETHFEKSLVLAFALPKEELQSRIPSCLELDLFQDEWAFLAVALVKTKALRPKGFPEFLGKDFILAGYRIFVRYHAADGRCLRGLYILSSETDSRMMEALGNVFTQYHYTTLQIDWRSGDDGSEQVFSSSGLELLSCKANQGAELPEGSLFSTWKEARRFAGPMPFTFSCDERKNEVLIVEGRRSSWQPVPMSVEKWKVPFLEQGGFAQVHLANAFLVEEVPYEWKKGRVEAWKR